MTSNATKMLLCAADDLLFYTGFRYGRGYCARRCGATIEAMIEERLETALTRKTLGGGWHHSPSAGASTVVRLMGRRASRARPRLGDSDARATQGELYLKSG
jgi:hypothetical protein